MQRTEEKVKKDILRLCCGRLRPRALLTHSSQWTHLGRFLQIILVVSFQTCITTIQERRVGLADPSSES